MALSQPLSAEGQLGWIWKDQGGPHFHSGILTPSQEGTAAGGILRLLPRQVHGLANFLIFYHWPAQRQLGVPATILGGPAA